MVVKIIIGISLFFLLFGLAYWSGVIGIIGEIADDVNTNFVSRLPGEVIGLIAIIGVGLVFGIIMPYFHN